MKTLGICIANENSRFPFFPRKSQENGNGHGKGMGIGRREWKRPGIKTPSLQISNPNVTVGDRDEDTKTSLTW